MSVNKGVWFRAGVGTRTESQNQRVGGPGTVFETCRGEPQALCPASSVDVDKVALRVCPAWTILPWQVQVCAPKNRVRDETR